MRGVGAATGTAPGAFPREEGILPFLSSIPLIPPPTSSEGPDGADRPHDQAGLEGAQSAAETSTRLS